MSCQALVACVTVTSKQVTYLPKVELATERHRDGQPVELDDALVALGGRQVRFGQRVLGRWESGIVVEEEERHGVSGGIKLHIEGVAPPIDHRRGCVVRLDDHSGAHKGLFWVRPQASHEGHESQQHEGPEELKRPKPSHLTCVPCA